MKKTFFIIFFLSIYCIVQSVSEERRKIFYLEKKLEVQTLLLKDSRAVLDSLKDSVLFCEDRRKFLDKIKKSLQKVRRDNLKKYEKAKKKCKKIKASKKTSVELYNKVLRLYVEHKREKKNEEEIYRISILVDKTLSNLKKIEKEQKECLEEKERSRQDYQKINFDLIDIRNEQKFLARKAEIDFNKLLKVKAEYESLGKEVNILELEKNNLELLINTLEISSLSREKDYNFKEKPVCPVEGKISKNFGENILQEDKLTVKNNGLDFLLSNKEIKSIYLGKVIRSSWFSNRKKIIAIDHLNGYISIYIHRGKTVVTENDEVTTGQKIAVAGDLSNREVNYFHFELRKNGKAIDPNTVLDGFIENGTEE